jgi:hypothetical protein
LNPYLYCANNPASKVDPSGHYWVDYDLGICDPLTYLNRLAIESEQWSDDSEIPRVPLTDFAKDLIANYGYDGNGHYDYTVISNPDASRMQAAKAAAETIYRETTATEAQFNAFKDSAVNNNATSGITDVSLQAASFIKSRGTMDISKSQGLSGYRVASRTQEWEMTVSNDLAEWGSAASVFSWDLVATALTFWASPYKPAAIVVFAVGLFWAGASVVNIEKREVQTLEPRVGQL